MHKISFLYEVSQIVISGGNDMRQTLFKRFFLSLVAVLIFSASSAGFAQFAQTQAIQVQANQISMVERLSDFVKNDNIEFMINNEKIGEQIPIYADNQDVGFSILSKTSGYHYLYVVDGQGSSRLIYPNQFESEFFIQANQQVNFPSNNSYRLIAQLGQGTDLHIVSIVSPTPLTGFTIAFTNGFSITPPSTQVVPAYQAAAMRFRVQTSTQTANNCASSCIYLSTQATQAQATQAQTPTPTFTPNTSASTSVSTAATQTTATQTTATTNTSSGPFQGFASYQDYLDNFYRQNNMQNPQSSASNSANNMNQSTAIATNPRPIQIYFTPNTQVASGTASTSSSSTPNYTAPNYTVPNYATSSGTFQGFASYQAYLDNFYAQNGQAQGQSGQSGQSGQQVNNQQVTQTTNTQQLVATPVTVYSTQIGAATRLGGGPLTAPTTTTNTSTGAFQGFASYQDYLNNFYAQNQNAGIAANNQTTQVPSFGVNYTITQLQLQDANGLSYTQLSPQTNAQTNAQATSYQQVPISTDYSQQGFFDFEVGRSYSLFQTVGLRVISIQDSRCPAGVQCIQAGDITATVELEFENERRSFTVKILPGDEPIIGIGNTSLRFVGLGNASNTALRAYVASQ